ncbi:uncharacterized protein BO96DRAFT_404095 [Aspergillus niger CBS 101883]|uniref:Contig An01c0080, genomic contig n=2 Tax=Aspergillus niger TaxID=5061 RepID=A2Q803_ASPNC|nr:uncharacterized protein BO96DRAFT_404095 [Aspergillus niger CBS 101883]XP_059603125.1 uncharacterized protein An01g02570 [Aspergillus niger]PYH51387.1 hypothetical protein BO96DRAFT_404095 [Aspergillus niger CBS 101883]CAK43626.1 unnamed protein product [Aspergillus niger]
MLGTGKLSLRGHRHHTHCDHSGSLGGAAGQIVKTERGTRSMVCRPGLRASSEAAWRKIQCWDRRVRSLADALADSSLRTSFVSDVRTAWVNVCPLVATVHCLELYAHTGAAEIHAGCQVLVSICWTFGSVGHDTDILSGSVMGSRRLGQSSTDVLSDVSAQ